MKTAIRLKESLWLRKAADKYSMKPILFHLFGFPVPSYGVFYALGLITSFVWVYFESRRMGLNSEKILDVSFWLIIGILVGTRLFHVIVEWDYYGAEPVRIFYIWEGGMVFYGGVAGAVAATVIAVRLKKLPMFDSMDAIVQSGTLGAVVGRVGCILGGCCYGRPSTGVWCLRHTNPNSWAHRMVGAQSLYPTQFYSVILLFAVFIVLVIISRRRKFSGQTFWSFFLLYPIGRFIIEFYRGDPRGMVREPFLSRILAPLLEHQTFTPVDSFGFYNAPYLSTSQFFSILIFITAVTGYIITSRRAKHGHLRQNNNHDIS